MIDFQIPRRLARAGVVVMALAITLTSAARAQTPLTLDDALRLAAERSESLAAARAGEARASADAVRVRSQRRPQLNFVGSYERTLASEFTSVLDDSGPVCPPLTVDSTRPLADRVAEIERAALCGGLFGGGFDFGNLPFGQRNAYRLSLSFSQALYAGGRISAQEQQADLGVRTASLTTAGAQAELALDVTRAFYEAALSDRLLAIAESSLAQAEAVLSQAQQAFQAGRQPEFEVLRAEVTRDNQRPAVIRARANREIAYLRLRQLLELPQTAPLQVDVDLAAAELPPPAPFAVALTQPDRPVDDRVTVRQAQALVQIRQAAVTVARSGRRPAVNLTSSFGQVGYPTSGAFPGFDDFRTNWTVGASVQVPILTGSRLAAEERSALADVAEAEAQLRRMRELAELDAAAAKQDLTAAQAVWEASARSVQQAQRAYEIAELRYREGVSTQLELSDSRLALQTAQATRAQAARDLQVARARLALLPDLPVR